jgi:hypothetical protein
MHLNNEEWYLVKRNGNGNGAAKFAGNERETLPKLFLFSKDSEVVKDLVMPPKTERMTKVSGADELDRAAIIADNFFNDALKKSAELTRLAEYPEVSFIHEPNPDKDDKEIFSIFFHGFGDVSIRLKKMQENLVNNGKRPISYMEFTLIDSMENIHKYYSLPKVLESYYLLDQSHTVLSPETALIKSMYEKNLEAVNDFLTPEYKILNINSRFTLMPRIF